MQKDENEIEEENQEFVDFLTWEKTSRDTIDFKKIYVDITGDLIAGLLLSQIIYWHLPNKEGKSKLRVFKKGKPCIAKSRFDWWEETRLNPTQVDKGLRVFREKGIARTEIYKFNGAPTTHIFLNEKKLLSLINKELKTPKENPKLENTNMEIRKQGHGNKKILRTLTETTSKITNIDKKIKDDSEKKESSVNPYNKEKNNIPSEEKRKIDIPQKILDGIAEVITVGNFPKHKLPADGEPPTAIIKNVYNYLISIKSNRFCRDFKLDINWVNRNRIDKGKLKDISTWDSLFTALRKSAKRLSKMKVDTSLWPADKTRLKSMGLNTFLYNPIKGNSWFLHCLTRHPQKLKGVIDDKNAESIKSKFTEEEQEIACSIMREGWNVGVFWGKVTEMKDWFDENIDVLNMVVNSPAMPNIGSFRLLLGKYKEFADGWGDFHLNNFGIGNGTWGKFSEFMSKEYGVVLNPSKSDINFAKRVLSRN